MQGLFRRAAGYQGDALNLPVKNVDEAVPFYEQRLGFRVVEHHATPIKAAILERDGVRIGLAENGGDPTRDGSFFEVRCVDAAFYGMKGRGLDLGAPNLQRTVHGTSRAFFHFTPAAFCSMLASPLP